MHAEVSLTLAEFADKLVEEQLSSLPEKEEHNPNRHVLLNSLRDITQDRDIIRSELLNMLAAARETTACLLSNIVWELSRRPDVLSRLRQEINEHIGDKEPTYQQLKDMKYLKAIINESHRIYPIIPSNAREALVDTYIPRGGGPEGTSPVFIPKSSYVCIQPYSMHRREDIFGPNADKFVPERWLDDECEGEKLRPGWGFVPFSGGPRVCIGMGFANIESMMVIVGLVRACEIEGRDEGVWVEKFGIACTGEGGCRVALRPLGGRA
jgi:cytochrome P450